MNTELKKKKKKGADIIRRVLEIQILVGYFSFIQDMKDGNIPSESYTNGEYFRLLHNVMLCKSIASHNQMPKQLSFFFILFNSLDIKTDNIIMQTRVQNWIEIEANQ